MLLPFAVCTISLALVFYSIAVWSEKLQKDLKKWHLLIFFIGLIFDLTGTILMIILDNNKVELNFHGLTGFVALALMLVHVIWASIVIMKNNKASKINFHKFSIIVWLIWLVPYVSGMILNMKK
jgi:TIGR03987 family protein